MSSTTAERPTQNDEHVVVFRLGSENYAIDIGLVQEIIRMQAVTPIPGADYTIAGVTSFRGRVIPVVDLRQACGAVTGEETADSRIVVVTIDAERTYGLIVDAVSEVLRLPGAQVEPVTSVMGDSRVVRGIAKLEGRLVALLDLDGVIPAGEVIHEEEAEAAAAIAA